ncbi:uncharacterized protein LOC123261800 [Cotesia glomerata]|uniref:uncharacterized protein LOC123261800 n=1 Tax=Cotesia glomerata TaxID=32391 RepID=UPI001D017FFB|nr:uncharacterized protein LOC123261800 [Cotesia glomerata]
MEALKLEGPPMLSARDTKLIVNFNAEVDLIGNDEAKDILKALDLSNVFDGLRRFDGQITVLEQSCQYIKPVEIPLGRRMDNKLNRITGTYQPTSVMDTFQYVPIIETLKLVISNPNVLEAILHEQKSPEGILSSFLDGQHAETHEFLQQHPHALRLQLYYDELEIVNPLGSKTGIHKLGAFYYSIQNIPSQINYDLNSIHVLALCADVDVKKYGFKAILQPFLNDLEKLESDAGILVNTENGPFILRATLAAFIGDGLAVHDVFNLLGPSCNQFCRLCMYSRENLHAGILQHGQERTLNLYQEHLDLLTRNNFSDQSKTATGMRGNSCLNESRYFHITRKKVFDPMHDFLCGICPMVIKLVLKQYILVEKKFDTNYLNGNIASFQWGFYENVNKPSANFTDSMLRRNDHLLSQKAMQVWCLIRALPFLLFDKVDSDDEYMALIKNLLQIMEIVFTPKLFCSQMAYLGTLIKQFRTSFQNLFPDVHEINQFHHLFHYPECILWSGPAINYWCMREEAKHGAAKARAQAVRNFKNPPKTLIKIFQCGQSAKWGGKDVQLFRLQSFSRKEELVDSTLSRQFLLQLNYAIDDKVLSVKSAKINGVEFRLGLYVCLKVSTVQPNNLPLFGKIKELVILNGTQIYCLVSTYITVDFDVNLHAYSIEHPHETDNRFIAVSALANFKPFCPWNPSNSQSLYISLRHILL